MANVGVEHEYAENVCHRIQILIDEAGERQNSPVQISPSLHRAPKKLHSLSPESFFPYVVSIGPRYRRYLNFERIQEQKATYLLDLLGRLESPPDQTMRACVNKVLANLSRIRACYPEHIESRDDDELAEIMVVDACFIIELIYKDCYGHGKEDFILQDIPRRLYVKRDLVLLENQIPYFVLHDIFECTILKFEPTASLTKLVLSFLEVINPFQTILRIDNDGADATHDHILGLLQKSYHPNHIWRPTLPMIITPYPVTNLAKAGVKFRPYDEERKWPLAMKFNSFWDKSTLTMPVMYVNDSTESVLRNLIAYEQCSPQIPNYITSYALVLQLLCDSKEDILNLQQSEVLISNMVDGDNLERLISGLCKEIVITEFVYTEQWRQLHYYYNSYFVRIRRTYFSGSWSLIASVGGFLIFVLTVVQTFFSIRNK